MTKKKVAVKKQKVKKNNSEALTSIIIKGMQEKKGHDIVILDLRNLTNAVTDFFIVCHGNSDTQVEAIVRSVEDEVYKSLKEDAIHKEGMQNAEWVLLDYFNVMVHVFQKDK